MKACSSSPVCYSPQRTLCVCIREGMSGAEQALHDLDDPLLPGPHGSRDTVLTGVHSSAKDIFAFPPQSRESQATVEISLSQTFWQTIKYLDTHIYGILQGRRLLVSQATKIYQSHIPSLQKETLFYQGVLS